MIVTLLSLLMLVAGIIAFGRATSGGNSPLKGPWGSITAVALLVIGLFGVFSRSFVIVGADEVGHLNRIYLGGDMAPGQIIALDGQKGPQAEILPPGFHFIPFVRVLNDVETLPIIEVPEGHMGLLMARDGRPLREGQFLADPWAEDSIEDMLDAKYFLAEGDGQKGPQLTVLKPGRYRLNQYLWEVTAQQAVDVPTGHVAVIRSNVSTTADCPNAVATAGGATGERVSIPVVPEGCIGVWQDPLPPGRYYLNQTAYVPTLIPTRLQTWQYKGGYTDRRINLTVGDNGKIEQDVTEVVVPSPPNAADQAINVRVEGWTIPVEMRVVVQVHPKDAPLVVAAVGDLQRIEDSIITPTIRDVLRTIGGQAERRVLDFIERRDEITALVEEVVAREGVKAGVTVQEVRMGEPAIPPELLVARLREQLATQLLQTYRQEQAAQEQRIETEKARAQADQQPTLVEADIARQAAEFRKDQLRLEGEGEKLKLSEIADGQAAIANVLGADRTLQLQMLEKLLDAALQNPAIIKVPNVSVTGSAGIEGGAAVLGQLLGGSNAAAFTRAQGQGGNGD